jgi:hypothetical protein
MQSFSLADILFSIYYEKMSLLHRIGIVGFMQVFVVFGERFEGEAHD